MHLRNLLPGLLILAALILPGCTEPFSDDPFGLPDPTPIEDRPMLHLRFYVEAIEPGVSIVVDRKTERGWMIVGSSASWQAIEPLGQL